VLYWEIKGDNKMFTVKNNLTEGAHAFCTYLQSSFEFNLKNLNIKLFLIIFITNYFQLSSESY